MASLNRINLLKNILFSYVYVVHVYAYAKRACSDPLDLGFQEAVNRLMWVLDLNPRLHDGAASALSQLSNPLTSFLNRRKTTCRPTILLKFK